LSLVFASAISACGGPEKVTSEFAKTLEDSPEWVLKGCAAYTGDKDPHVCGVGSVAGTANISLARSAAEARGRTDIARSLQVKVKAMLKDYQATTTGGEDFGTAAADEQHVVDVSKQITDMTLNGSRLQETWVSPHDGTYFVLMVLDVESFKKTLDGMQNLKESIRKAVIERADKAFKELDTEIDKERAAE
jgi:hypothetical protein